MKYNITIKNIVSYIVGNLRYKLFYSKYFSFLMRKIIKEQIKFRVGVMDKRCYDSGACVICGCTTIKLQMADKQCDKPCYPPMMSKKNWKKFMKELPINIKGTIWQYSIVKSGGDFIMCEILEDGLVVNRTRVTNKV